MASCIGSCGFDRARREVLIRIGAGRKRQGCTAYVGACPARGRTRADFRRLACCGPSSPCRCAGDLQEAILLLRPRDLIEHLLEIDARIGRERGQERACKRRVIAHPIKGLLAKLRRGDE